MPKLTRRGLFAAVGGCLAAKPVHRLAVAAVPKRYTLSEWVDLHRVAVAGPSFVFHPNGDTWKNERGTGFLQDPLSGWEFFGSTDGIQRSGRFEMPDGELIKEGGKWYRWDASTQSWDEFDLGTILHLAPGALDA